ncbi:MAG: hypothetical protein HY000_26025 [Planctomycetes bacterium]|nr:hypothetical protein [Planctomycetota bacterium]
MTWDLSRFQAGDLVEVRSEEEILASLDSSGRAGDMPFMPEMLQFCGRRFRVSAVAHKTCDTVRKEGGRGRRVQQAVHLTGVRCDGSAHGGCQADCNLFWKDEWLKPADAGREDPRSSPMTSVPQCTEQDLHTHTVQSESDGQETRYTCQATQLCEFSQPLAWWDPRQYVYDVWTGNHSVRRVMRVTFLASLRSVLRHAPFGFRTIKAFHDWAHVKLTGRLEPFLRRHVAEGERTPTSRLDLKPGEFVRIKSQEEIELTVDKSGKNRGMSFDVEEMAPYCGRIARVRKSVTQIIDEPTGKMITMKQPCIILEGVVCNAEYASCRLNCPRAIPSYWREVWLERVEMPAASQATPGTEAVGHSLAAGDSQPGNSMVTSSGRAEETCAAS